MIVLPARASGKWDNDQHVEWLRAADAVAASSRSTPSTRPDRCRQHPFGYRAVYVHAKVAIIDDEWLTVGSANLNKRGLITDGEINVVVSDPALARRFRVDLWSEHLALPPHNVAASDPIDLADHEWPERALENADIIRSGERPLVGSQSTSTQSATNQAT